MLGFIKFWLKIGLTIATPILLLAGAFYIGKQYANNPPPSSQPVVQSAFIERTNPTQVTISTPYPTVKPKTESVIPTINPDPVVNCRISSNCGGGTKQMKSSECSNSICCEVGNNWVIYPSKESCIKAQESAVGGNQNPYPPCAVYYPLLNKTETYEYTSPETCQTWKDRANSYTVIPPYASPTPEPVDEAQRLADIQSCKDSAKSKYDSESTILRNMYRAAGALSSSDYGLAAQKLSNDYNYWLYLCENAY